MAEATPLARRVVSMTDIIKRSDKSNKSLVVEQDTQREGSNAN